MPERVVRSSIHQDLIAYSRRQNFSQLVGTGYDMDDGLRITLPPKHPFWTTLYDDRPIVDARRQLIFFSLPKVGCTETRRLLKALKGVLEEKPTEAQLHHPHFNNLTFLYHYPREEAIAMLHNDSWIKATFVRDPAERLLSAYMNKFVDPQFHYSKHLFGRNDTMKFEELICMMERGNWENHWMPQSYFTRFEATAPWFHFLGSFQHFYDDMHVLFRTIGEEALFLRVLSKYKSHNAFGGSTFCKYYNKIDVYERVQKLYARDYRIYSLPKHPYPCSSR